MVSLARYIDLLATVAGFGLVVYGVARVHVPAALIVAGVMLLAGALWRRG